MDLRDQLQKTLGDAYTLERELGGGGMSRVFVAEEKSLRRKVVVKLLPPELTAGVNVERFNREILVAAKLQHPHIVPVLTAGESNGLPYYTMPFVEGESLRARLARTNALSITDAVSVLRDVAKALAFAHEHGIVHRDIKPDNVLLTGGSATVTDFGIAKAISASRTQGSNATLTQMGTSIGTPAYMSPEQAAGDPDTDHRTDIYSFGCMAYELLAARPPFTEKTPRKLLAAQMGEKPTPVSELRPDTPAELAELVMRCLEKEPDHRPQHASDLVHVLETVTSGGTQPAMPSVLLGGRGMFRKALAVYAVAFVAAAILAKAAIVGIGLPDWVFPGSLLVMALVLPVILFTGYAQRVARRAMTATPTYTPGGTPSTTVHGTMATMALKASPHLSWYRAARGGAYALGAFVVLVAAFMVMRALGIGPAGSLLATGKLKQREPILLTDFRTTNVDSTLGRVVSDAVRAGLAESSVISLVPTATISAALVRMKQPSTARVDAALAREIAIREGMKAIVEGDVTGVAGGYIVAIRLVRADSGTELASFRETGEGPRGLIDAADRLARALRGRAGESLRAVQGSPKLAAVTTSSLDALRAYSAGVRANSDGDFVRAIQLLRQATEFDPSFAMAWQQLATTENNARAPRSVIDSAITKAYVLRDRLPDLERYRTLGTYFGTGPGRDRAKAIAAYEALIASGDSGAVLNLLGMELASRRDYVAAEAAYVAAVRKNPTYGLALGNLVIVLFNQGKTSEVDQTLAEGLEKFPANVRISERRLSRWYHRGDLDRYARALDSARGSKAPEIAAWSTFASADLALSRGRIATFGRLLAEAQVRDSARGAVVPHLMSASAEAHVDAVIRHEPERATQRLDRALLQYPLGVLAVVDRPYFLVASTYAAAGKPERARAILAQYAADVKDTAALRENAPRLHGVFADVALAEGRLRDAATEYRLADQAHDGPVDENPTRLLRQLGVVFDHAKQADSAIMMYERYLETPDWCRFAFFTDAWSQCPTYQLVSDPFVLADVLARLGELYAEKGDASKSASYLRRFIELWKNADADLQPRVAAARVRLKTLAPVEKPR